MADGLVLLDDGEVVLAVRAGERVAAGIAALVEKEAGERAVALVAVAAESFISPVSTIWWPGGVMRCPGRRCGRPGRRS